MRVISSEAKAHDKIYKSSSGLNTTKRRKLHIHDEMLIKLTRNKDIANDENRQY